MTAANTSEGVATLKIGKLLKLLDQQQRVLLAAGGDKRIIAEHAALIEFLRSASVSELSRIFPTTSLMQSQARPRLELFPEAELANITTSEVEKIIENEATPRRCLESIAIHRFKVPRGSMRSFSNRSKLVEKLQTMLRNERAHMAIETVARRQV